jgi:hypothetical protein
MNLNQIEGAIAATRASLETIVREISTTGNNGGGGRAANFAPTLNHLFDALVNLENLKSVNQVEPKRGPGRPPLNKD